MKRLFLCDYEYEGLRRTRLLVITPNDITAAKALHPEWPFDDDPYLYAAYTKFKLHFYKSKPDTVLSSWRIENAIDDSIDELLLDA